MEVKKVAEEWEILDEEEEAANSEEKTKKLVPQMFYKQVHVFGKKASERMLTKRYGIMQQRQRSDLCQGRERCIHYQERKGERCTSSLKNN